uniref:Tyrosine specific protein phosphatases domain-containing protein n=2 Tax=Corethron hystrix TaxID=216773 RepID=A0A7S1BHK0_9STRA|mmetsp:Transcript_28517/g.65232  ORF Transcript_28517/g.65232 Transcript_28517/m.65232 type:complete len:418 (+) Transcript_28517:253-1506(+)
MTAPDGSRSIPPPLTAIPSLPRRQQSSDEHDPPLSPQLAVLPLLRLVVTSSLASLAFLYVLNQKHLLVSYPKFSDAVSRITFYPTLPITFFKRMTKQGGWFTEIGRKEGNNAVILGGCPLGFLGIPDRLHKDHQVRSVINMCSEFSGPSRAYRRLGITQTRLPTVDHLEPSFSDLIEAVKAIESCDGAAYVHCKAGHGRGAAAALCWMIYTEPEVDPKELNERLYKLRHVRRGLWKQPNIQKFGQWRRMGGDVRKWQRIKDDGGSDDGGSGGVSSGNRGGSSSSFASENVETSVRRRRHLSSARSNVVKGWEMWDESNETEDITTPSSSAFPYTDASSEVEWEEDSDEDTPRYGNFFFEEEYDSDEDGAEYYHFTESGTEEGELEDDSDEDYRHWKRHMASSSRRERRDERWGEYQR